MANKIYVAPETARYWDDSAGDLLLDDINGLAADAVACGAYVDLGSGSRAEEYEFEMIVDGFGTAPVVGETVDLYFIESQDSQNFSGQPSTAPGATSEGTVTLAQLKNALFAGSAVVHSTTAGDVLQVSGVVRLTSRYVAPVVHNNTADALNSSTPAHKISLTPLPAEVQ